MSEKLVLIDGHSIINRAFYGIPELTNSKGLHTNAIYGFLNILFKILEEEKPDYLTVAFDVHAPTFRHVMYEAYKGTRKAMPEELREQVPVLKEVLQAMGILTVEKAGLEADDILGTLAKKSEARGIEVSLVSGDRDLLQIATDRIKIRIPKTKPGKTEIEDYYTKDVIERYHVTPMQFIELKALMGDTADNIPGVPKVGEKTATSLIETYGSIDEIYNHIQEISKKSIKESLENNRELADLSKTLATIKIDAEFDYDYEMARVHDFYTKDAYDIFKQLEFSNFLSRFQKENIQSAEKHAFENITSKQEAEKFFEKCKADKVAAFLLFGENGIAISTEKGGNAFFQVGNELNANNLYQMLNSFLKNHIGITANIKKQYQYVEDLEPENLFDIEIAAYLLNPLKSEYLLENIANEFLGTTADSYQEIFGKKKENLAWKENLFDMIQFQINKTCLMMALYMPLKEELEKTGQSNLFTTIEMPLTKVLYEMEKEGILVKPEALKEYGESLNGRIDELQNQIYEAAGTEFNINSPKQLGEILFERLQLPGGKKTKTGYSTAADVLEKMAEEFPIVKDILEYRGLAKLKSTYADGLANYISEDSRIHTTFNQTITATGRISSTEPNLQNIPMRMELGRLIRKVFIPRDGYVFVDADYSQIELRILADMSADQRLIEAYKKDADIHRITASQVFHIPFEDVTDLQRRNAKAVNFGIVYGISSFGLSQDLSITKKEANEYIEKYFETYPKVKEFQDTMVEMAKRDGYITTLFGRRRPIPELNSSNFMQRSFGERVAMNSPIQGTAADIMKIAMIKVADRIKEEDLCSRMILQVHDEIIVETKKEEEQQIYTIIKESMEQAADLAVKLEVDIHTGSDWYEAK